MRSSDFIESKNRLPKLKRQIDLVQDNAPRKADLIRQYIEDVIAVKGHAWCMDVSRERKQMAGLILNALVELDMAQ